MATANRLEKIQPPPSIDIVAFREKLSQEKNLSPEKLAQFEASVSNLFTVDAAPDKLLLIKALTDGVKYYIDVERQGGFDSSSRIFLNAAAFVNRGEDKYRADYEQAVNLLTQHALVEVLNTMDTRITPSPVFSKNIKPTQIKHDDLSTIINRKEYVFKGYDSINILVAGGVVKELTNVFRVSQELRAGLPK